MTRPPDPNRRQANRLRVALVAGGAFLLLLVGCIVLTPPGRELAPPAAVIQDQGPPP